MCLNDCQQFLGVMPTIHNLCGELFPTKIRATANGIVFAIAMVACMINVKIYPIAVATFGFHWVMYFYAVTWAFMVTWGGLTIKDTDHLSLTEIQDLNKKTEVSGIECGNKEDIKGREDVLEGDVSVIEVKVKNTNIQNARFQDRIRDLDTLCHAVDVR